MKHNYQIVCFLSLLAALLSAGCTKEETPEYRKILSEYSGSYYIERMLWERSSSEGSMGVDIDGDGASSNDILAEIRYAMPPMGWQGATFSSSSGRRGYLEVNIPMVDCEFNDNGTLCSCSIVDYLSARLPMTVYTDLSIHWGHFDTFSIGPEKIGLYTFADVNVVSGSPQRIVLSVGHYYVYDRKTNKGYDGSLMVYLSKTE